MKLIFLIFAFICITYSQVNIDVVIRDFQVGNAQYAHPDMEYYILGVETGLVNSTLASDKKPVYVGGSSRSIHSQDTFSSWFRDTSLSKRVNYTLAFSKQGTNLQYSNGNFFPLDGLAGTWPEQWCCGHNYHFTLEMHTKFTYQGNETFDFAGDDDVWVFINNRLAIDLGGIHPTAGASINLKTVETSLGLVKGNTYDFDFYFAERHTSGSSLTITTSIALQPVTLDCSKDTDGDGVPDCSDNCVNVSNADQRDCNQNGIGDACDSKRGPLEYPFLAAVTYNFANNQSTDGIFGSSTKFEALSATGIQVAVADPVPNGTLTDLAVTAQLTIRNNGVANCLVTVGFNSNVGTSSTKNALVTPGNFSFARTWLQTETFYSFKFKPVAGSGSNSGSGVNTLTIKGDASCSSLLLGSVIVNVRYTYQSNNNTGYYQECLDNRKCLYGTQRFGGYCACWSGAWGKFCGMDTAEPGQYNDPDPRSVIDKAWAANINNISVVYYKLDYDLMLDLAFYRNWTNHPTCPDLANWQKVYDLETGGVVNLDSAFFEDQKLVIYVSQPFVDGRADGAVFLNNDNIDNGFNVDCYYPRSNYIAKLVEGCKDIWRFAVPWNSAKSCGWNITQEEVHLVYRGQVIVHNQEWLGIEQWRIIRAVLRIKLRFQRFVSVQTDTPASLFNDRITSAAITKQLSAVSLTDPAVVELTTVLQYPYKLYNGSMGVAPAGKVENYTFYFDNCAGNVNGTECRQNWRTTLKLTEGTCTLDGIYSLNWTLNCYEAAIGNTALCPLQTAADFVASVTYKLKSENFCATLTVDVGIVGNLRSYNDDKFDVIRIAYIVNRRGYFLVKTNSELNTPKNSSGLPDPDFYVVGGTGTVVSFSKVTLVSVSVKTTPTASPIRLYENKAPVVFETGKDLLTDCLSIAKYQNGTTLPENQVGFSFNFTRKLAASLTRNQKLSFFISAEVQVTYSNLSKKRYNLAALATTGSDNSNYELSQDLGDDGTGPNSTVSDTTATTASSGTATTTATSATTGTTATTATSATAGTNATTATTATTKTSTTSASTSKTGSNSVVLVASFLLMIVALLF